MSYPLLDVQHISVDVDEKSVLHDISLKINQGETHVFMGPTEPENRHSAIQLSGIPCTR